MSFTECSFAQKFLDIEEILCKDLLSMKTGSEVKCVYNPIEYAYEMHWNFLARYVTSQKLVLFLGMNPGPWGMSQTGKTIDDNNRQLLLRSMGKTKSGIESFS